MNFKETRLEQLIGRSRLEVGPKVDVAPRLTQIGGQQKNGHLDSGSRASDNLARGQTAKEQLHHRARSRLVVVVRSQSVSERLGFVLDALKSLEGRFLQGARAPAVSSRLDVRVPVRQILEIKRLLCWITLLFALDFETHLQQLSDSWAPRADDEVAPWSSSLRGCWLKGAVRLLDCQR